MRTVIWIWSGVCLAGWILVSILISVEEAQCRAESGFICFTPGEVVFGVGVLAACVWAVGALVIAVGVWFARRRRQHRAEHPH